MGNITQQIKSIWQRILNLRPRGFWPGFTVGFFYFAYVFLWMWSVDPARSMGLTSPALGTLLLAAFYLGSIAQMSAAFGLFGMFVARLSRKNIPPSLLPLFWAGGFAFFEYLRSWFLGFAPFGEGSVLGPHWTFGNIAYWFAGIAPLRSSASLWGIYGLEFFLALSAGSAFIYFRTKRVPAVSLAVLGVLTVFITGNFLAGTGQAGKSMPVAVIQTERASVVQKNSEDIFKDLTAKLELLDGQASASLVVLPEGAGLFSEIRSLLDADSFRRYVSAFSGIILDNSRVVEGGKSRSRTIALSPRTNTSDHYDKNLLTPGGEFVPYFVSWPSRLLGLDQTKRAQELRSFVPGSRPNLLSLSGSQFAVLICSEVISPEYARRGNPDFLVAQNSLAIFSGNRQIESQLLAMARLRSAENFKYTVWSSNYGRSYIIDEAGAVQNITSDSGYQILTGEIVPNTVSTWYNKLGDWPILSLSLLLMCWSLTRKRG